MSSTSNESSSLPKPREDMFHESERLKTFVNWPHSFLDPNILAKSGLYLVRAPDTVTCNFCHVSMSDFKIGEDEISRHFSQSMQSCYCYLLNGKETRNMALQPNAISDNYQNLVSKNKDKFWADYVATRCPNDKYLLDENEFPYHGWCIGAISKKCETETTHEGLKRPNDGECESEEERKSAKLDKP